MGKGVIVDLKPSYEMPVDKYGNIAHLVGSDVAITARKNPGTLLEQQTNAFTMALVKWMRRTLNINEQTRYRDQLWEIANTNVEPLNAVWQKLTHYYRILTPAFYESIVDYDIDKVINHITICLKRSIILYMPIGSVAIPDHTDELLANFPLEKSRVTFIENGRHYESLEEVLIAPVKYILLDKTARDLSGVASAYSQVHGLPAAPDSIARTKHPFKASTVKFFGEQESGISTAICGNEFIAEAMDRNSNPKSHGLIVEAILDAVQPTNIERLIDRKKHPYGDTRSLELFNSFTAMGGFTYEYLPEERRVEVDKSLS